MQAGYLLNERYKIIRTLGEGGMATVYLAEDIFLNREVAIKILRLDLRDDSAALRRFHREARALTELSNPHIVNIYDISEKNGLQYLVMEYVPGTNLKEYIESHHPLTYPRVVEIMLQVLSAVKEAHRHGIIHRDLKPQNILIDTEGNIKITDFGIAVAVAEDTMTRTNTLMGSVHYISPEQARGSIITKQSDIYSLGIILFEMLTGHVPYEGETAVAIALKHYQSEMPSVKDYDQQIPQSLENVVLHATAKDLASRYQNVDEMEMDLSNALDQSRLNEPKWHGRQQVEAETMVLPNIKDEASQSPKKATKKRRQVLLGGLLLVSLMVIVGLVYLLMSPKEVTVPDVRGMTVAEAQESLNGEKLALGKIRRHYSSKYYSGQIITTNPEPDTTVKQKSKIDVVLSKGQRKEPFGDYRGQSYQTVAKKLTKKGASVTKTGQYSNKVAKGRIISQSISAHKKVSFNETNVIFTVSAGAKSERLRDLSNYTEKSAQDYANDLGLKLVVNEADSSSLPGMVIAQQPQAGTKVKAGDTLTVTIAKNDGSSYTSSNAASSSTDTTTGATTFSFDVEVPYAATNAGSNKVQIYIADSDHSYSDVYQTATITKDTNFSLTFTLKPEETGKFKVVRDGQVIAENNNVDH